MKKILLPIITLLLIGLTLISCDLLWDNDSDVKRLLFIDVTPNKSVFSNGDNIKDFITVKSFYSDGSDKTLQKEDYITNLLDDQVTSSTSVTITYREGKITKTKDIHINVNDSKMLISLDVKVSPTNYIFSEEDKVKEHLIVKGIYSDGSEETITDTDYSTDIDTVTSNTNSVTVTYTEDGVTKSNTLQIFVKDDSKTLFFIDATLSPTDYVFSEGDDVKEHLKVEGFYSDGTVETIKNTDYGITTTTNSVTVTYDTKTKTIPISVGTVKTLISLNVIVSPTNFIFSEGDNVKEHLIVKGYYSDGSENIINSYSTDIDTVTSNTKSVTVTYEGKSNTLQIFVKDDSKTLLFIDVTLSPTNYVFSEGDNVKKHLIVKGYYSDSSEKTITDTDYSTDITTVTSKTNSVTVSYASKTKTVPISVRSSGNEITLNDIEVTTNTDILYEGDNIKDYLIVKGIYSDGVKTILKDGYLTNLTDDKVTSTTNSVTVTYIDGSVTKTKSINIPPLGDLSDYEIGENWFNNFSGVNKNDVTSISFVKEKPSDVTDEGITVGKFSYYKKGTNLYVVGERIVFPSNCSEMFSDENEHNTFKSLTKIDLSNVDTSNVTEMSKMFYDCKQLTSLDLSNFNTSKVTNMSRMFYGCEQLTSLNLSKFDTSKVTDMSFMFDMCNKLTSLDLSIFNTSNVTNMSYMFESCMHLRSLNISKFNTSKVTNMESMFYLCLDLTSLDLSKFDTSNVTNMSSMFKGCKNIESLDLSSFDITSTTDRPSVNTSDMFDNVPTTTPIYVSNVDDWTSIGAWNFQIKTTH